MIRNYLAAGVDIKDPASPDWSARPSDPSEILPRLATYPANLLSQSSPVTQSLATQGGKGNDGAEFSMVVSASHRSTGILTS